MTNSVLMDNVYRIGAVSRLTGIPADTLRIWERRYHLVDPQRTEKGGRLYSQADVNRLTMIKALVDQGHAISTVANLDTRELNDRLSRARPHNLPEIGSGRHDVCIVGQAITVRANNTAQMPEGLELAGTYTDLDSFMEDDTCCQTLVIEFPFLDRTIVKKLQDETLQKRYDNIIVIYAFAPSIILRQMKRLQITTERAPVSIDHIWQMCAGNMPHQVDWSPSVFQPDTVLTEPAPKRQFSSQQLAKLSQMTSALKCECPHHLSSIIETLVAFEQYSTECENDSPQDAALHSYLHIMTAKARWLMEVALEKLAEVESIDTNKLV
jgi:DNA-binding transcriptional MerR regulator